VIDINKKNPEFSLWIFQFNGWLIS